MGQNAKKFLKKGNSKRGLPRFLGNPDAHRNGYGPPTARFQVLE